MRRQKAQELYDKDVAVAFYQERYARGYIDDWPIEKKQRILELIRSLELPCVGEALDFGCGTGVFTDVIKQALPSGWNVYGTDISEIAIEQAKKRYPGCAFFVMNDSALRSKRFDFLFTHHVLEHVYNLSQVLTEIDGCLKGESTMFHILPCGNEGSFEHSIALLRKDGINLQQENRFFFEDEGHIRRLTTEQMSKLCGKKGFVLAEEYYSNQYYGGINWITQSGPSIMRLFADVSPALDEEAKVKLIKIRRKLLFFWALRYPVSLVESRLRKKRRTVLDNILLLLGMILYPFAKPMDNYLKGRAANEWIKRKMERNGSEMYLYFKKQRIA